MQTKAEFYSSLPAKRMGAGVVFLNAQGEVLVVQPTYKETWEIPGGIVEQNESPRAAAVREVEEELQLKLIPESLSLISIDYMAAGGDRTEALMFIFFGGILNAELQANIELATEELRSFRFAESSIAASLLGPVLGPRILRALKAIESGSPVYFEGQY